MKRAMVYLGVLLVGAAAVAGSGAWAAGAETIYQSGKAAFDKGDYLTAAKHLFAFRNVAEDQVDSGLLNSLNDAIAYCDEQISLALRTKEELDKYGHITEVVIEASGKADGAEPRKETREYHKPAGRQRQKPGLPANVPQVRTDTPAATSGGHLVMPLRPIDLSADADAAAQTTALKKELRKLQMQYKLLEHQQEKSARDYAALKERYTRLEEAFRRLREEQQ